MGTFMKEDDIFIDSLLDLLNLRFAPSQGTDPEWFGGLDEMVALQREFQIFKPGRPFAVSVAALNLGNLLNPRAKNRWTKLLQDLASYTSSARGENADADIVKTIVENLEGKAPLPIYFKAHDSARGGEAKQVLIEGEGRPVFYLRQNYVTISLPMKAREG